MRKAGILSVADTLDKVNCTYINPCAHNFMVVFAEYIRVRLRCARTRTSSAILELLEYIRVRLRCASQMILNQSHIQYRIYSRAIALCELCPQISYRLLKRIYSRAIALCEVIIHNR